MLSDGQNTDTSAGKKLLDDGCTLLLPLSSKKGRPFSSITDAHRTHLKTMYVLHCKKCISIYFEYSLIAAIIILNKRFEIIVITVKIFAKFFIRTMWVFKLD